MVVRVRTGKSLRRALSYNERKLSAGKAELLLASNFPIDDRLLGFSEKMKRFQSLIDENPKVRTNAVHISLNFPPEEKLSNEKLQAIAMEYMERIGFAGQPFLVYRHMDTRHPHIHIVTTNLRRSQKPVNLHNLVKRESESARKAIEIQFGLIPAQSRPRKKWQDGQVMPWPANYGKEETKHAITNIVGKVLSTYKFGDLDQFNAILGQYRVTAYPGSANSRMRKAGGLVYQLLDPDGQRVGIPIKASAIDQTTILKNLEKKFAANALRKVALQQSFSKTVERCLSRPARLGSFQNALEKQEIGLVVQRDDDGKINQAFFVDHRRKAVFTADELNIRLERIAERLTTPAAEGPKLLQTATEQKMGRPATPVQHVAIPAATLSFLHTLLEQEDESTDFPNEEAIKKKKRRRGQSL